MARARPRAVGGAGGRMAEVSLEDDEEFTQPRRPSGRRCAHVRERTGSPDAADPLRRRPRRGGDSVLRRRASRRQLDRPRGGLHRARGARLRIVHSARDALEPCIARARSAQAAPAPACDVEPDGRMSLACEGAPAVSARASGCARVQSSPIDRPVRARGCVTMCRVREMTLGALHDFRCPSCGYSAEVSGGPDIGEASRTVTISCATCKELHDVVVSEEPWKEPPDLAPERPPCPRTRARTHATSVWNDPGPCPRCGSTMRRGEMTVLWD